MSEKEKQIVESLAEALKELPEAKRERLLGFAEGWPQPQRTSRRRKQRSEPYYQLFGNFISNSQDNKEEPSMRIPDDTHFQLRNRMYAMRATSNYLCEKIGRSACYFSNRLNGKLPWDLGDVYNLCDILRIPYDEIPKFFPRDGKGRDVKHDS